MSVTRSASFLLALGGIALLAACMETPTEFRCRAVVNQQASVRGDSIVTTSGLLYRELAAGTGAEVRSSDDCQFVRVRYVGRLLNGPVFSQTPEGVTYDFSVGRHLQIAGFEQGMVGMKVGGSRQLIIPPALGYGSQERRDANGNVVIPANSTLVFDVTLVSVQDE
jgi:peptidylprolyl isomerase